MRTEMREYFIIVHTHASATKMWTPFDWGGAHGLDLLKLPARARYGSYDKAEAVAAEARAWARAQAIHLSKLPYQGMAETIRAYETMEFKVAKVAITVDLLG